MRIKLDENVSVAAVARLAARGHDVDTAVSEGLSGHDDASVWHAAQAEGRLLVTQDLDFSDVRRFAPGSHAGLLLIRLPESDQWRIADFVDACFSLPDAATWSGCFVVASPHKVRVLRPGHDA